MKKESSFYLELLFRDAQGGRPDKAPLYLPVRYAWQEGPDDLHIQLNTKREEHYNLHPEIDSKTGDYIVPLDHWLRGRLSDFSPRIIPKYKWANGEKHDGALVYHIGWTSDYRFKNFRSRYLKANAHYLRFLESCWYSPNA
jgi:hypothetical protein